MHKVVLASFLTLTTLVVSSFTIQGVANSSESTSTSASSPVLVQLALRDRTVVVTTAQVGRQYSVLGDSGEVLHANLSEEQFAEQYPELVELLQPAIADPATELMMLAPVVQ